MGPVIGDSLCTIDILRVNINLSQNRPWVKFAQPSLLRLFLAMASKPGIERYVSQTHW